MASMPLISCTQPMDRAPPPTPPVSSMSPSSTASTTTTSTVPTAGNSRPAWLGTRTLPLRPDGFGEITPTPPELVDRRLVTVDFLPPPAGEDLEWSVTEIPAEVLARSTWGPECPVGREMLRYIKVSFFGFDERFHTGELIVHRTAATGMVEVFRRLHAERFPIEEMKVVSVEERDRPPTGDGNNTTAFVCREIRGGESWSQHAYGLAIDVNSFHNPYVKEDLVLPELASAYVDRERGLPGMIYRGDVVARAFARMGWEWGGDWRSLKDWQHFSSNGR